MAEIRVDDLESLRHDPLCPAPGSTVHGCICVELRERDARVAERERRAAEAAWPRMKEAVRADERERWLEGAEVYAEVRRAEAERDAARAERDVARESEQFWNERWQEAADQREQYHVERDAARAEVAALREQLSDTALDIAEYRRAWLARWRRCPVQNDEAQP